MSPLEQVDGAALRDAALGHAIADAGDWWHRLALQAISALAETRDVFTVDDLRRDGLVPEPVNPQGAWGAALNAAAKAHIIEWVRYERSMRPAAHRRPVSVWRKQRTE